MKILFIVNWYTPKKNKVFGAGVFHYEQAMALRQYCDIRLYWPFDTEAEEFSGEYEHDLYTYRSPWREKENKIVWLRRTRKHFIKIIKEFKPDLLHANVAYPAGLLMLICNNRYRLPMVLTEHAPIEQMYLYNPIRRWMRGYVYRHMIKNICVSKDSKARLEKIYPNVKYQVIYNAVIDPEQLRDDGEKYRRDNMINCAIVAAFYDKEVKGYQYLIPAMRILKAKGKNMVLHICGGGQYKDFYKAYADKLKVADNCIFYGQCDRQKVYSIVRQMDFCISSSVYECSGVSVQEEMLLGKPVLVTRSGGANSLTTKETAIVVDRNSTEALAEGIMKMMKKYNEFDQEKIRKYARENFEISRVTERYLGLYKESVEK